jgi:hypothetical protein
MGAMDTTQVKQLVDEAGGPRVIIEGLRRHREICKRLDREHAELLQKHPGKWVAMGAAGILSTGTSLNEMLSVVKGRGLDTSEFAITFLDPEPPVMLL